MIYFIFAAAQRRRKHKCDGLVDGKTDVWLLYYLTDFLHLICLHLSLSPLLKIYVWISVLIFVFLFLQVVCLGIFSLSYISDAGVIDERLRISNTVF